MCIRDSASTTALAAPVLRAEVSVTAPIVTVGDMFADAGAMADTPLFRAPKPGTTGMVLSLIHISETTRPY